MGNFFVTAGSHQVCLGLADSLEAIGWKVYRTSFFRLRPLRLAGMVLSVFLYRKAYQVALVELFSGLSFLWAEAVVTALRIVGKPIVLALHGGQLPEFSARYPGRVRRLLRSAAAVTSPSAYLAGQMREFRSDIEVLPNPLDLTAVRVSPAGRSAAQAGLAASLSRGVSTLAGCRGPGTSRGFIPRGSADHVRSGQGRWQQGEDRSCNPSIGSREKGVSGWSDSRRGSPLESSRWRYLLEHLEGRQCATKCGRGHGLRPVRRQHQRGRRLLTSCGTARKVFWSPRMILERWLERCAASSRSPALAAMLSRGGLEVARKHDWAVVFPRWERLFHRILERTV